MSVYVELRPYFTDEESHVATITLDGSGSIAGQIFEGELVGEDGTESTVTVAIASASDRTLTLTFAGQSVAGDYRWSIRRTDNGSETVVATGVLEVLDPLS